MKKLLCFVLTLIMMLGVTGCSSKNSVEGTWLSKDGEEQEGYSFDALVKNEDGEMRGQVSVLPSTTNYFGIFYSYTVGDNNEIIITQSSPSFSGNSVGTGETEYDVLTVETEDENRVLISSTTGEKYYFTEKAE